MKKWEATTLNGDRITEEDVNWELVKNKTQALSFNNNGQIITLPNEQEYIQGKTASAMIGSNKINIESRYIGIIKNKLKILIRVDESTGDISLEVSDL